MSKYPEHDQEFFYKFTTMEAARLILEGGKFRYSSPANFNDPFDIQTELYFKFDIEGLPNLVAKEVDELVCGRRVEEINIESDWGKAIIFLQEQHKKGSYRREHLDLLVKPLIRYLSSVIEDTRKKYNDHWKELIKTIRVFCVSEHNESVLMWSHYAKYHTGVCFKLKVMPEKDNPLCAAKKVNYLPEPPSFFSVEEWIDSVIMGKDLAFGDLYHRYPLSKSDIWEYEDEWRVWAPFEDDGNSYLDIPITEGEIEAIYFGVNAKPKEVTDLIAIAKEWNVAHFYQSEKKITEYGLAYNEI